MKLVTVAQMRNLEDRAATIDLPSRILMENAGRAVAREIIGCIDRIEGFPILVLVGPGNNGGDGLVAARYLQTWGAEVKIYLCAERSAADENYLLAQKRNIPITTVIDDKKFTRLDELLFSARIVIDAILGIGKSRPITGNLKQIIAQVNGVREKSSRLSVVAVDIPSGLDADTGYMDPAGIRADITVTLGYPKTGLYSFPGAKNAGKVIVADIGIPPHLADDIKTEIITRDWLKSVLPPRPLDANKGTFGKVLVIGGSLNYIGAPYLACSGAMRVGAGLVTLATGSSLQPIIATKLNEVTYLPLPEKQPGIIGTEAISVIQEQSHNYDVLLIGCGLGQNPATVAFVTSLLATLPSLSSPRIVIDADALNALASLPRWWQRIPDAAILTPHPGEMSRLTGHDISDIQSRRLDLARESAALWKKTVVLKGAYTVIAAPDGKIYINPVANAGLASAGTGDVLSGIIAGLLAQGLSLFDAASCGVSLHSRAGEMVGEKLGDTGILASDLLPVLPLVIKQVKDAL